MALQTYTWETGDYAYQSWSNGYKIHLTLTEESTSTANNTSLVSYKFWVSNGSNNRFTDNDWDWTISIGGQTIAINNFNFYVYPYNVTQTIASGQITVTHNSDGSLNMPYNVSVPNVKASNKYGMPAMALSGTWALTTIPRASGVSCSTANIGTAPTITISSASSSFTHTLTYLFGTLSGTIVERTSSTVYTDWVLPTTFYSQIPNATSGFGTIYCHTYNGSTHIGTSSCIFTAKVNESISRPTITATITDQNSVTRALTGDSSILVRYYSTAYVAMTATAQNSATLVWQAITNGSTTYETSTATFANVETGVFSLSATDSRGFTTTVGRNLVTANKFVSYVRLTCNIENTKPDASGNITVKCDGSYFNGSFGAVANTLTVKCRYKNQSGTYSDWYTMTTVKNGNYYGAYTSFTIPDFNYQAAYTFECQATDELTTVTSAPNTAKSMPVFHWSETDFVFEVPVTFNAGVDNLEANTVKVYGNPIPVLVTGVWTPTLSSSAVSSYSTQYGWYSKMGQTVSVGFFIKATCRSGYNSTSVTIGGLPFTPMYAGAGGGMCSGAYVSAGFTFQCFVAETDGSISTRVQACNNTSSTNLSTSKSGCWYPSGGGDITISGTITYISG